MHAKLFTEPITSLLAYYRAELVEHPLFVAAKRGTIPIEVLKEFAFHQFSDSVLWIPMLAQMKSKAVRSRRLRDAIADNIACEAGLHGTSHVVLAVELMRSLAVEHIPRGDTFTRITTEWLSGEFARFTEPEVAGWLLVAETLVPVMFAAMQPCFERVAGCATAYFTEHIAVDADEHATWMAEAVDDIIALYGTRSVAAIAAGMQDAWDETLEIPDALWARHHAVVRDAPLAASPVPE